VLREIGETIKVMLLHPITDEEFPLLARVKAVHSGSKTEPKGMTLVFETVNAQLRLDFHAFVEHGVTSQSAIQSAASMPNGKEVRPLFSSGEHPMGDPSEASPGAGTSDEVTEVEDLMLVTEEEISSDRLQDLLSDLRIEAPEEAPPPPPLPSASAPAAIPIAAPVAIPAAAPVAASAEPAAEAPVALDVPPLPPVSVESIELWEELRNSLRSAPEDVGLLFRLGSGLARQPATSFEAIGYLQRLLALEPHHPLANGALALAYAQMGQRAAAERHLSRARRLGQPVDSRIHALLAVR